MKSNYIGKAIGGAVLGIGLLGIGAVSSTTTQAQYRNDDQYQRQSDRDYQRQNDRDYQRQNDRDYERQQRRRQRNNNIYGRNRGDDYPNLGGSFQLRQTALNAGYNEGIKQGRKDRNRGGRDYRDNSAYRNATKDYNSRYGDRSLYQEYYRMAYERGYDAGVNGY